MHTDRLNTSTHVPEMKTSKVELHYDQKRNVCYFKQTCQFLTHRDPYTLYIPTNSVLEDYTDNNIVTQLIKQIWHGIRKLLNFLGIYNYNKICINHRYLKTETDCKNLYAIFLKGLYTRTDNEDVETYSSYASKFVDKTNRTINDHATLTLLFYSQFKDEDIDTNAWAQLVCLNVVRFIALINPMIDAAQVVHDEKNFYYTKMLMTLVNSIKKIETLPIQAHNYNEVYSPAENTIRFANYMIQKGMIDKQQLLKLDTQDLQTISKFLRPYAEEDKDNTNNDIATGRNSLRKTLIEIVNSRKKINTPYAEKKDNFPPTSYLTPQKKALQSYKTPKSVQKRIYEALNETPVKIIEI
jgi:hypothetical protein